MEDRLQTLLERVPSHFAREEDSNNYKLMKIIAAATEETREVYDSIQRFWDIDQSYGVSLDRLGKEEGIAREDMDDEEYRKMIKIQYILNMSDGDIPTMNLIMDAYFGENFIGLEEGWRVFDEPATLLANLRQIPFNIPYKMLKRLKPAGVGMILGTKQKMDLGLNVGGAYVSQKQVKILVPAFKMDDLPSQINTGLLSTSYKVSSIHTKAFEMPDSSDVSLQTGLMQGNYKRTQIGIPLFSMEDNVQAPSLFGGAFSIYKKTTILAKG